MLGVWTQFDLEQNKVYRKLLLYNHASQTTSSVYSMIGCDIKGKVHLLLA